MKAEKLKKEISEVVWSVMKSNNIVEYNDGFLHDEIREKIMPLINQFKEENCKKYREALEFYVRYSNDSRNWGLISTKIEEALKQSKTKQ